MDKKLNQKSDSIFFAMVPAVSETPEHTPRHAYEKDAEKQVKAEKGKVKQSPSSAELEKVKKKVSAKMEKL